MDFKHIAVFGAGIAVGLGAFQLTSADHAPDQDPKPAAQTVRDFPDLVSGLRATPGCIDVKVGNIHAGKTQVIYAWFKNKKSVNSWYHSDMHRGAMKKFFPAMQAQDEVLAGWKDDQSPVLIVASVTPSDKPHFKDSNLAISQIAIEMYTPLPGGIQFGGGFAPKDLDVKGMSRINP